MTGNGTKSDFIFIGNLGFAKNQAKVAVHLLRMYRHRRGTYQLYYIIYNHNVFLHHDYDDESNQFVSIVFLLHFSVSLLPVPRKLSN